MTIITNNPNLAGQQAGRKEFFGEFRRYAVYPVHTRFDAVSWFVADAMVTDEVTSLAAIIRQAETKEAAMAGLSDDGFEISGAAFIPKWRGVHPSTIDLFQDTEGGLDIVADGFEAINKRLAEIAGS